MAQRVLITGGSSGLGASLATLYSQQGCDVSILDVCPPSKETDIAFFSCDLKSAGNKGWPDFKQAFDIVVCNAGISLSGDFIKLSDEDEQAVMDINYTGHKRLLKHLLAKDLIRSQGHIAFVCSATQFLSFPIALGYGASKGALDGFAQALESYLIGRDISVTRIYPGPMNTPHSQYYPGAQTEGGRKPEQSAPGIVRAIHKRRRQYCPDPVSRFYAVASHFIPRMLAKKAYHFYKDRLN